jgi:polysaccharide pyruvyl transferase WcaK-like protein
MKPKHITFLGNFGTQNLGNECTLQAIIHNTLKRLPDAKLQCLCTVPEDTVARHNIPAFGSTAAWPDWVTACLKRYRSRRTRRRAQASPLQSGSLGNSLSQTGQGSTRALSLETVIGQRDPWAKWLRIILIQIPKELLHWIRGLWVVKGSDVLIVPGTGLVSDYLTGPFGWAYDIFKWSTIARVCRVKVFFVGIGVGPVYHTLSKWFIRTSLGFADYRSYRDTASKQYMEGLGFHANGDRVCPDLAFGLPAGLFPESSPATGQKPVIGVGLKNYDGPRGIGDRPDPDAYCGYLNTMATFVTWLCVRGYPVRVLIGDILYDSSVKRDFMNLMQKGGLGLDDIERISQPVLTVDQLLRQLAATDIVISPRFHNLVLALMLNKPVIALSDHQKLDSLMAGLGLEEYCVPLRNLDVDTLVKQLTKLERNAGKLKPCIKQKVEEYHEALNQEYSEIFPEE